MALSTEAFELFLNGEPEDVLPKLKPFGKKNLDIAKQANSLDTLLEFKHGQLLCALSFNPHIEKIPETPEILGLGNMAELHDLANKLYANDPYKTLSFLSILKLYSAIREHEPNRQRILELLPERLSMIEALMEATVDVVIIKKYKEELRAIYFDAIADISFAEKRLQTKESGFFSMINEVTMIVRSRLIPVGDIFYRDNVLPEEKRRLLEQNLVPIDLVRERLRETYITAAEKRVLQDWLNSAGKK